MAEYDSRTIARFWSKVSEAPNGCMEWSGYRNAQGYGYFSVRHKMKRANRIVWEIVKGPIPHGLWVLHHCDNPPCVNPEHLFTGTRSDNVRDSVAKGRAKCPNQVGSMNRFSKLTEDDVVRLRSFRGTHREAGALFRVSRSTAAMIRRREGWKHVE